LREKRNLTHVYLDNGYWLAESRWEVAGLAGFGLSLGELRDRQVPGFPSLSSSQNSKSEIEANVQMLEQVLYLLMIEVVSP